MSLRWISTLCAVTSLLTLPSFAQDASNPDSYCNCSPISLSKMFTSVAKKSIPGVVFIKVEGSDESDDERAYMDPYSDDVFQKFFGPAALNCLAISFQ